MDFKSNAAADVNITLSSDKDWKANVAFAEQKLAEIARTRGDKTKKQSDTSTVRVELVQVTNRSMTHCSLCPRFRSFPSSPVSVMIHCAGSWMGGGVDSLLSTVDPMLDINLKSAISTAHLAGRFLDDSGAGLLMLTGAAAASNQNPTSSMLAYGMSKAATHQLATSLAQKDAGLTKATVVCVLPSVVQCHARSDRSFVQCYRADSSLSSLALLCCPIRSMIDTPSNRAMSSNAEDYLNWTPPADFAALTLAFAQQLQPVPAGKAQAKPAVEHVHAPLQNGGFYTFNTVKGKTSIKLLPPVKQA